MAETVPYRISIPLPLTEGRVTDAPEYAKMHLSIDNLEQNHKNIPHFHIYYGSGNQHRSVGYKITTLTPLDEEKDKELICKQKDVKKYLEYVRRWQHKPYKEDTNITNLEYMIKKYNEIVGIENE